MQAEPRRRWKAPQKWPYRLENEGSSPGGRLLVLRMEIQRYEGLLIITLEYDEQWVDVVELKR